MNASKKCIALMLTPALMCGTLVLPGCSTAPPTAEERQDLHQDANASLNEMYRADPGLRDVVSRGYGYVMFSEVGKGGAGVGGAYGRGEVFEGGRMIGYADMSQGTVGAQLGGQIYDELIVFENKDALERFKRDKLEFAAGVAAVVLKEGAAAAAKFDKGVAVFVRPRAGAMLEAAIGGQQFTFQQANSQ